MVPELVARAEAGDFQGMLAVATLNEGAAENMAIGMQLSVLCAEDLSRIDPAEIDRESAGTVFARHLMGGRLEACRFWPRGDTPAGFHEPVASDVPTLVLSGALDPVTPPSWGDAAAKHLTRSRHIVVPAAGHGVVPTGCGQRLLRDFITSGDVSSVDASCATEMKRPPFFLTPAGPDPTATGIAGTERPNGAALRGRPAGAGRYIDAGADVSPARQAERYHHARGSEAEPR
jgi:hypothetical protein